LVDRTGAAPAGWYPDPSGEPRRRYWDGAAWTEHVAPLPPPPTPHAWPAAPDPRQDLEALGRDGRRARTAVLIAVPFSAGSLAIQARSVRLLRESIADLSDQLDELETQTNQPRPLQPTPVAADPFASLASLPTIVVGVLFLIWFHRAATIAARLGRPARRTPGWAVGGWFIPIGNFFLPYQSARDLFRPGESARRRVVARWWAAYLLAGLVSLPLSVVAGLRDEGIVTAACVALSLVVWLFAALAAGALIDEVSASLAEDLPRAHP
jgi:hypothetical protein